MRLIRTIHTYNGGRYAANILQSEYVPETDKVEWWQVRTDKVVSSSILDDQQRTYHCTIPAWIEIA